jgi:hypothetical protein
MSKQATKRVRREIGLDVSRDPLPAFAWPGGYPMFYLFRDGGVCCAGCANENIAQIDAEGRNSHGGWALTAADVNYEDTDLHCDHCGESIPSAYGE